MRGHDLRYTRRLTTRLTVDKSEDEVRDTINDEGKLGQNVRGNEIGKGQRGSHKTSTKQSKNKRHPHLGEYHQMIKFNNN